MTLASLLDKNRIALRAAAARCHAANLRVFGSAAKGTEGPGSDIDLLVDPLPDASLFDLGELQVELERILGVKVDLLTPGDLPAAMLSKVLAEARPV